MEHTNQTFLMLYSSHRRRGDPRDSDVGVHGPRQFGFPRSCEAQLASRKCTTFAAWTEFSELKLSVQALSTDAAKTEGLGTWMRDQVRSEMMLAEMRQSNCRQVNLRFDSKEVLPFGDHGRKRPPLCIRKR